MQEYIIAAKRLQNSTKYFFKLFINFCSFFFLFIYTFN